MKRNLITAIAFVGLSVALLFSMSTPSFAVNGELMNIETACLGKNGVLRYEDCSSDEQCLHSETCVKLGAPPTSCPSIIGGAATDLASEYTGEFKHISYFTRTDSPPFGLSGILQSVETTGSFRNLNVVLDTTPGVDKSWEFIFEVGSNPLASHGTKLTCNISGSVGVFPIECQDLEHCVDVEEGSYIGLLARDTNVPNTTSVLHTVQFDGCLCCDGEPPTTDESGHRTCIRE